MYNNKIKVYPKIILCSATITGLIILLFSGMVVAEKNTKLIGFGETEQYFKFNKINDQKFITVKFIGQKYDINVTNIYNIYKSLKNIKNLGKIPYIKIEDKLLQNLKINWCKFPFLDNIKRLIFTSNLRISY